MPKSVYSLGNGLSSVEAWFSTALDIEEVLSGTGGDQLHACVSYLDALLSAPARAPAALTAARRVAPFSAVVGLGMHGNGSSVHDACNSWSDTVWSQGPTGRSVAWTRQENQAINGLDEGVWNRTVGDLGAKG